MRTPKIAASIVTGTTLVAVLSGCHSGGTTAAPKAAITSPEAATTAPAQPGPLAPSGSASNGTTSNGTAPTLTAEQVADNGLPSKVGAGKLSTPTIKRLTQYFEDKVSHAYATGNAQELDHYLAGPMLNGNIATINLLTSKQRRNVFKIKVQSVKPQTNTAHSVIFTMIGDMTLNYFYDPNTKKVLDNGLPGPSQVQFTMFFDQNPKTGTWYWTGEKSGTGTTPGSSNAQTLG